MNIKLVGEKDGKALYVCVALEEVQEAVGLMEGLGYTVIVKEALGLASRFRGMKTNCLVTLREMAREREA